MSLGTVQVKTFVLQGLVEDAQTERQISVCDYR
jgi:hypothetical protein